jgi:branched-chain amino acid transport system permease protein
MPMGIALQLLFTGLGIGSIYALVALGFVLIYRATNVVNFAQGDFAMLGAFSMVVLCIDLELPYWVGILITLVPHSSIEASEYSRPILAHTLVRNRLLAY